VSGARSARGVPPPLPARRADSHKGDYGRILIVAGSRDLSGAAALCALGALRAGAGLVRVALPDAVHPALCARVLAATWLPLPSTPAGTLAHASYRALRQAASEADAVALGPGLGGHVETAHLVRELALEIEKPLVLDADGLNAFAGRIEELQREQPTVLTPHPGEFARLCPRRAVKTPSQRLAAGRALARDIRGVVVLKGHGTVVADARSAFVNTTGNPGMATGGSGDVLAGMTAALLVTSEGALLAARRAVFAHGLAGDLARDALGETSLGAEDLLSYLGPAFLRWQNPDR
jgi:NAD(P)H-hydrate epimerase